ncbi:MAG: permease [Isosphaeraceae bacterium]
MTATIFWSAVLRITQAVIQAAPTILVGLVVAGVFRRLLGHEGTRRLFGSGTWRELPQAWLIGMLMPVCSLGVIPVAREMRRAGIAGGTVLAFAMTAPLFNPLSLLYGLTLSEPLVIFAFAFNALIVVTLVGGLWDRLFPNAREEQEGPPPVAYGLKRMASVLLVGARELVGPSLAYMLIALAGVGLLCAVLPHGSLSTTMEHTNRYAPLQMAAVAVPAYATPMVAMSQLGSMFQHANSVGAAFVLLTLGAGLNLGLAAWVYRNYGLARGSAWFTILLVIVLGLAYAVENPLHPSGIDSPGHTHAFDNYCRPFEVGEQDLPATVGRKLKEDLLPHERVALTTVAVLAAVGLVLRLADPTHRVEAWLERQPEPHGNAGGWLNWTVPSPVLGGVALALLVAFSLVGCFAYYPSSSEVFEEMRIIRGEVLTAALSGNKKHAAHFIPLWDDWTRRLQVGVFLREGNLSPYRRMKAKVFRDRLEFLKHAVEEGDREESRAWIDVVDRAHRRMRAAFTTPNS